MASKMKTRNTMKTRKNKMRKNKSRSRKIKWGGVGVSDKESAKNSNLLSAKIEYIKLILTNKKPNRFLENILSDYDKILVGLESQDSKENKYYYAELISLTYLFRIEFNKIEKTSDKKQFISEILNLHIDFLEKVDKEAIDIILNEKYEVEPGILSKISSGITSGFSSGITSGLSTIGFGSRTLNKNKIKLNNNK